VYYPFQAIIDLINKEIAMTIGKTDAPKKKVKDKSKISGILKLNSSRKPYYYNIILWNDINHLKDYFEINQPGNETLAMTCFEPWLVDGETGDVYINPKLGELHFARDHWNINVISHEVQHAIIHRMRLIWPPAHLILLDEYVDAEEEIAYETGNWIEKIHNFLWSNDPGIKTIKLPAYTRSEFKMPNYLSEIKFHKTGLKLIKGKKDK
jgi:hypothetical protein